MDHENTVKAYSTSPSMLGRVIRWWSHKVLSGCVRFPRKSIHISSFFLHCVLASDFHPPLAVGATDWTCSTTNSFRGTRRGGTVVCMSQLNFETSFLTLLQKSPLWYTKSSKWIIIEIPRNIECLILFNLKYVLVFLHFRPSD